MIDGYGGAYEKLNNKDLVLHCLEELHGKIGIRQKKSFSFDWFS